MKAIKKYAFVTVTLLILGCTNHEPEMPYWLSDYEEVYKENPLEASRQWFKDAKMGMFVHFNIASLMEFGDLDQALWVKGDADERILNYVGISREDYMNAKSKESKDSLLYTKFKIPEFDAEEICQLAVKAKMKYITFTAHHWAVNFSSEHFRFTSANSSPDKRDLVAEVITACKKYNLAPFLYMGGYYKTMETDSERKQAILKELLTNYGPVAGIWFDGGLEAGDEAVNNFIKELQPYCLVSFKYGIGTCSEDYISPEFFMLPFEYKMQTEGQQARFERRRKSWEEKDKESWERCTKYKLREITNTMMEAKWRDRDTDQYGWMNSEAARRLSGEEAWFWLKYARYTGSNLLMSIGPRKDGSIHPDTEKGLTELGRLIEERGWPPVVHEIPERPGE